MESLLWGFEGTTAFKRHQFFYLKPGFLMPNPNTINSQELIRTGACRVQGCQTTMVMLMSALREAPTAFNGKPFPNTAPGHWLCKAGIEGSSSKTLPHTHCIVVRHGEQRKYNSKPSNASFKPKPPTHPPWCHQ